jgi:RNA-directed DNA polymerase
MNESRKSDSDIVPEKSSNKSEKLEAEKMEGRKLIKGNEMQQNTRQTQGWESVHSKLQLVHQRAKEDKKRRFTALMHHIYNINTLRAAYFCIKRNAAPGVDAETWKSYGENLEENLQDLSEKLKRSAYRAKSVRRVYIPKPDGRQRALGVTALEDKLVQRAAVEVLNTIYEADFLGYSYGFRPGRNQHKALDALYAGIAVSKVNYILDADIRDFFGTINHEWLIKFIEHRIADKRVVRLIQKWLKAGVLEEGKVTYNEMGTPAGGSASPLLANVYLHYVYDLWVQQWRKKRGRGNIISVRFADDTIAGFQYESDAKQFLGELKDRLQKFGLELHPEKTRLIEFGRYAIERRAEREKDKPATFTFLGFTHICGETKDGKFTVHRQTIRKKLHAKVKAVKVELIKRMHAPIHETGKWLKSVVSGHFRYFGVIGNFSAMSVFRYRVYWTWRRVLSRRSQKGHITWNRMDALIKRWIPSPRIYHEHPLGRIGVITQGRSRVR